MSWPKETLLPHVRLWGGSAQKPGPMSCCLSDVILAPSGAMVASGPISSCGCQTPTPTTCQISYLELSSPFQVHVCVPGLGLRKPPPRGAPWFFVPLLRGLSAGAPVHPGGSRCPAWCPAPGAEAVLSLPGWPSSQALADQMERVSAELEH